jgi:FkbM family methyltransferase
MSWHTNSAIISLRNIARNTGLTRWLAGILPKDGYERAFDHAIFSAVRDGDVVWDVGSNVGHYTKRFAMAVGPNGHVVAFEPFPATAERLSEHMQGTPNYSLRMLALGAHDGYVMMQTGGDDIGATNRIDLDTEDGVRVQIATGDGLLAMGDILPPSILKIDTEGFELDVLRGMEHLLSLPELRAVFVEVHFGLLTARGQPKASAEIEKLLNEAGFVTRWVDPSHISGERG